jgi:hypothetical protein
VVKNFVKQKATMKFDSPPFEFDYLNFQQQFGTDVPGTEAPK